MGIAREFRAFAPSEHIQRIIADEAGHLLTKALLTGTVDTTAAFYVDAETRGDYARNADEVTITLAYQKRHIQRPPLDRGSDWDSTPRAVSGTREIDR